MTRSGGAGRAKPPAARAKPPKTKTQQTNEGRWTDEEHDRVAIFNLYNTISTRWTDWMPHPDLLAKLGLMRRSLFREVKTSGNVDGGQFNEVTSGFEGELNG